MTTYTDTDRLRFLMEYFEAAEGVDKDRYDLATEHAERHGREPTAEDELAGFRDLIDQALANQEAYAQWQETLI